MRFGHLRCRVGARWVGGRLVGVDHKKNRERDTSRCSRRPCKIPAAEPRSARFLGLQYWRFVDRRQRKRDHASTVRAIGKVSESLLVLVRRQGVFDKGAELVRVRMLSGLEDFAHSGSDAGSIWERIGLRSLQQAAEVYFQVAGVGAQSFFGGPLAQASGLQVVEQLLAQIAN